MINLNEKFGIHEDKGVVAIEFGILAPLLILTVFGLIEIGNYVFCNMKMNRVAQNIDNIVARGNVTRPQLDALLAAAIPTAYPFDFSDYGCVLVSSISQTNANTKTTPTVEWTDSYPSGSTGCSASRINPASLPGGLVLSQNQTIITAEVFYNYQPMIPGYKFNGSGLLSTADMTVYAFAIGIPRQGTMTTLPSS